MSQADVAISATSKDCQTEVSTDMDDFVQSLHADLRAKEQIETHDGVERYGTASDESIGRNSLATDLLPATFPKSTVKPEINSGPFQGELNKDKLKSKSDTREKDMGSSLTDITGSLEEETVDNSQAQASIPDSNAVIKVQQPTGSKTAEEMLQASSLEKPEGADHTLQPTEHPPTEAPHELHHSTKTNTKSSSDAIADAVRPESNASPPLAASAVSDEIVKKAEPDFSRPGVTASPPKVLVTSPLSSAHSESVAKDLAEAEARADQEALEASQRGSSLSKAAAAGDPDDEVAPFTEENLQSAVGIEDATLPSNDAPEARPFSPQPGQVSKTEEGAFEPPEFKGLVFHDGIDALGRPVIVVNADAVAPGVSRKSACAYMLQRLEPIVIQGPYVLVLLTTGKTSGSNRLPAGWLAQSYRQMSYPFKKNVKHVILVRPSTSLNFMLAIMRPLISSKAYAKLKKVDKLSAMGGVTNSEVTLQHLGPRFASAAGRSIVEDENLGQGGGYQMPNLRDVELSTR